MNIFQNINIHYKCSQTCILLGQAGHISPENQKPNRTELKSWFFRLFGSVSVSVVGNFGFGARLRFWCSRNRITEPAIARTRKHRRSHPVVRIEGYQQPKPKAQHGPTVNTPLHDQPETGKHYPKFPISSIPFFRFLLSCSSRRATGGGGSSGTGAQRQATASAGPTQARSSHHHRRSP